MFRLSTGARNVTQERLELLDSKRFSPIVLPESATANDVWFESKSFVESARAKIVTSGTYGGALFSERTSVAERARNKTCRP
jgi:hypothetical protein